MRFIILGAVIMAGAAGFFWYMTTADLTMASGFTRQEANARIGQVSGALGGFGLLLVVVGLFRHFRGR